MHTHTKTHRRARVTLLLALATISSSAAIAAPVLAQSTDSASSPARPERTFTRSEVTSIIRNARKIVTPNGVEEQLEISIGGAKQWISVRGRDRRNPVLLVIHGGPASPEMPSSWFFENSWEDYFTVVQWDQRGAGKSYLANDPETIRPTITERRIVDDAGEVVQYLRKRYGKEKIFVLGHSWGSLVGITLAHEHPEWLYAYIGAGQMIDAKSAEPVAYANTLKNAVAADSQRAIAELKGIAPYPEADGSIPFAKINTERKWSVALGGLAFGHSTYGWYEKLFLLSPDYSEADVQAVDKGSELSFASLLPVIANFNYSNVTKFGCPILLFEGRHDNTTPSEIAEKWMARVQAPGKKLVWFENSAHMMMIEEPGRFLVHLVQDARPYAGVN